jgi:hypothetical protein
MPSSPADVTAAIFGQWRDARRGRHEAEDLSNPYWTWLIRSEVSAYSANQRFGGPSSFGGKPAWSAERFGQTTTPLPDGRTVLVAGEHEDYYDPDFFIYNDVIVVESSGTITILGYPEEVFPPTDFHSATPRGHELLLIGNLGYQNQRIAGSTQLLRLNLETWSVRAQAAGGEPPGWIHRHDATLIDGGRSVLVTGGLRWMSDGKLVENIDDWRLELDTWTWERLTRRTWPRFEVRRADGRRNELWEMRQALWHLDHDGAWAEGEESRDRPSYPMPRDRKALEELYQPAALVHRRLPQDLDAFDVHRIEVDGVIVRYKEGFDEVGLTVEGDLPDETVAALCEDLLDKLRRASGVDYVATPLSADH